MKVKLLKKIRKRYFWYFNNAGFPVLLDHKKKEIEIFDVSYCMISKGIKTPEELAIKVKVSHTEWAMRIFKRYVLGRYGYSINKSLYRSALKYAKGTQKKN